jgi:hypothetical protein
MGLHTSTTITVEAGYSSPGVLDAGEEAEAEAESDVVNVLLASFVSVRGFRVG